MVSGRRNRHQQSVDCAIRDRWLCVHCDWNRAQTRRFLRKGPLEEALRRQYLKKQIEDFRSTPAQRWCKRYQGEKRLFQSTDAAL